MSPESFNRLENASKADLDRFIDWLFSHTLTELRAARGDATQTRDAWIRYLRRGLKADLLLDELMKFVPELFRRANYPEAEARSVLAMIKTINLKEMGIGVSDKGVGFHEDSPG
jgi:hypothetical protein